MINFSEIWSEIWRRAGGRTSEPLDTATRPALNSLLLRDGKRVEGRYCSKPPSLMLFGRAITFRLDEALVGVIAHHHALHDSAVATATAALRRSTHRDGRDALELPVREAFRADELADLRVLRVNALLQALQADALLLVHVEHLLQDLVDALVVLLAEQVQLRLALVLAEPPVLVVVADVQVRQRAGLQHDHSRHEHVRLLLVVHGDLLLNLEGLEGG